MQDTPNAPIPPPPSYQQPRRSSRWWIPLAIIGGLLVLVIVAVGIFLTVVLGSLGDIRELGAKKSSNKPLKDKTVLVVDLSSGLIEYRPPVMFNFGGDEAGASLMDVLQAIKAAKTDDKIKGIYYRAGGASIGMTKLTEVREALVDFKTSGKFIYAFIESGTKAHYYIATVADSIFMPQEGFMEFQAFGASGMFFKKLSDKIGVSWHVEQFEEYKSAAEMTSRENWSEPAKEMIRALIVQRQQMFVEAVAKGRSIDASVVTAALDRGVYIPDSLKALGLIDGFARESEVRERIHMRLNPDDTTKHPKLATTSISQYNSLRSHNDEDVDESHGIAIVYASGAISSGSNRGGFDSDGIHAKSLIADLRKAEKNDDVDIIILRIDSPGGSAIASDEIWATLKEIRKTKPVYASMSDVAASGGYYIAMGCDTIIAHPSTITGSIGVIMAIPNISGTLDKVGVTIDTLNFGKSSTFMNTTIPFNDNAKAKLREFGGGIYHRFVQKVADSRKKSFEETRLLARGRVWTGEAALKSGLIDVSGGLLDAIRLAKKRIGVDPDKKVNVAIYPEEIDNLSAILKMFGINQDDEEEESAGSVEAPVARLLQQITMKGTPVEEVWKTLPAGAKEQFKHAAHLAQIGMTEHALMMLPDAIPFE